MMKKRTILAFLAAVCVCMEIFSGCSGTESAGESVKEEAGETTEESVKEEAGETAEKSAKTEAEKIAEESTEAGETAEKPTKAESEEILIAAAASLKNAYEEDLIPMFQERYPQITVKGTYDSSGKLQTQIEEGLEADVFMSAAVKQMKALDEGGWIASETVVDLLENKIVLIVPAGQEEGFTAFEEIVKADSIALGDPESVPAGQYAREALTRLGLWEDVSAKASFGTNVTEVLNQVAAASADAGIVYATDAASMADKVSVVAQAPEASLSDKVIYPVAVVKGTAHREAADCFVEFLTSQEAIEVFQSYGFTGRK